MQTENINEQGSKPVIMLNNKNAYEGPISSGDRKLRRLATEKHPTIEAIIAGLFSFEKHEQAVARLETVKSHFIISSKLPKDEDDKVLKLWIRGYELSEEEVKQGYLGNYAAIRIIERDNKFSLIAEKQRIALKYHPQRKRPKKKHPDWGHPALRIVKKGIVFETIEEAQKILRQLHEEYPDVSIPNTNKLYIIIYGKAGESGTPAQKYILEIKPSKDGGFQVNYKVNSYSKTKTAVDRKDAEKDEKKAKGYFTSMVELKKSGKKKLDPKTIQKKPVKKTVEDKNSAT